MTKNAKKKAADSSGERGEPSYDTTLSELADANFNTAIRQTSQLINHLCNSLLLNENQRIEALKKVISLSQDAIERFEPKPVPAPHLFKNRPDSERGLEPSQFILKYFSSSYNAGTLNLSHIRGFDSYLYESLLRERRNSGGNWESNFNLPTKKEALDRELTKMSDDEKARIKALAYNLETRRRA